MAGRQTAALTGLLIGPVSLNVTAPGTEVVSAYAGQQVPAIVRVVLTEGAAALALAVVVLALGRAALSRCPQAGRRGQFPGRACFLVGQPRRWREDASAGCRDGLGDRAGRPGVSRPSTAYPSGVLAVALIGSGFGHPLLSPALARVAYVSLPLLLIWVAGGVSLARSTH